MAAVEERYVASGAYRREEEGVTRWPEGTAQPSRPGDPTRPDGPFGWRYRVWQVDHRRWRREVELPGGGTDIAVSARFEGAGGTQGRTAAIATTWERRIGSRKEDDPSWLLPATDYFWTFYPFDPCGTAGASFGGLLGLESRVETGAAYAGREAVRLTCVPDAGWPWDADPLWWGADEFELVVDAERGVVLRLANRLEGEDFDALEVEEVHYDERFSEDVFATREPLPR
jgi:hypothetical protein